MAYPTDLDTFTDPAGTDKLNNPSHSGLHQDINTAVEALERKVGIDNSTVNTTHDYKLSGVADGTKAVSLTGTETLTNKTLTTPIIASLYQDAGKTKLITFPAVSDTVVCKNTSDTLTNKTLTAPTIADFTNATHDHADNAGGGTGIPEASITFNATGHDHSGTTKGNPIPAAGLENDAVETAKIKDANVTSRKAALTIPKPSSNYVKDITGLTATDWTDLTDVTMTFTPDVTSSCFITFSADAYTTADGGASDLITFRIVVDDVGKVEQQTNNFVNANNYSHPVAISYVATGLDASEHTIKIQYKQSNATWAVWDATLQGILIAE